MEYETEEQQVEALKGWWAENGRAVIAGIVLGAAIIVGWSFWENRKESRAVASSERYSRTMSALAAGDAAAVASETDALADEYDGTLYAAFASLAAARAAIENGDLDAAAERLGWAVENAPQEDVRLIARVRLARVNAAGGDAAAGLERLPDDYPEAFAGLVEEARGDLLVLDGKPGAARDAYGRAQSSGNVADPNALTMKLDDLAAAENAS